MNYLCNAFSLNMLEKEEDFALLRVRKIKAGDIPEDVISAVGYTDTASVLTRLLGFEVKANRISILFVLHSEGGSPIIFIHININIIFISIGVIFIYKTFYQFFIFLIFLVIFISIFFTPILFESNNFSNAMSSGDILDFNPNGFVWPSPGYTRINSYFGKRNAPTAGASSFHKGIDIGAPEGSAFIAVSDGEITFTNFLGGGGYTITLTVSESLKVSYCHCNPNFIVHVGDIVKQGQVIRLCWS